MTKNVVSKSWTLLPSFDGNLYSAWPNGDKPSGFQTTPTILGTNIISGPASGGDLGLGAWISIFGYSFGRQADVGAVAGVRAYFRNPSGDNLWHEVANYRALNKSRVWTKNQSVRLIVQIGGLSGQATNGAVLDLKLTVNGVDTNVMTAAFTVQPGRFWFVDNVNGNDATGKPDDITKPFRYLQFWNGSAYTGLWAVTTAQGDSGLQAGDTIVLRGGTWNDQTGFDSRWCRFRLPQQNGSVPTGVVGHGYIHFVNHPGPILGHAPEDVHYVDPAGGRGGFHGPNSAYVGTTGQYVTISGLRGELNATTVSDGAFLNLQNSGDNWRVTDCEAGPWPSTITAPNAKAGGICGQGIVDYIAFNYIHDIDCDHTALENHGIYIGDNGTVCSKNWEIAYNWIVNIPGGSGIQFNNNSAADTFDNMKVHHNWVETTAKYGLNLANSMKTCNAWNNVIVDPALNALRFDVNSGVTTLNVNHNWFVQTRASGAYQYIVAQTATNLTVGTINIQHNGFVATAGHAAGLAFTNLGAGDTAVALAQNLWYDLAGTLVAAPAKDATGIYGNPNFTSISTSDYTCQAGGAGLAACSAAETLAVADDYYGMPRPVTGTGAPGGTKNDIGPMQGVGV